MTPRGMMVFEILFFVWAAGVALFWLTATPESAPQQAALAGQALVLVCIPYCALSMIQRGWIAREATRQHSESSPVT